MKHLELIIIAVLIGLLFVSQCTKKTKVEKVTVHITDTVEKIEYVELLSRDTTILTKIDSFVRVVHDSVILPVHIYDTIRVIVTEFSEERLFQGTFNDTNYTLIVSSIVQYNQLQNQWIDLKIDVPIPQRTHLYIGGSFNGSVSGEVMMTRDKIGVGYGYDLFQNNHKVSLFYKLF